MVIHIGRNNNNKRRPKKIMTKWVKSYKDIPYKDIDSSVFGFSDQKKRIIYAIKGKTSEADVLHEEYHIKKNHPDKPRDYKDFARQEIDSTFYAYKKTGQPYHIIKQLRAILNDICINEYNANENEAIGFLKSYLFSLDIPDTWKEDYKKIKKEYDKAYK